MNSDPGRAVWARRAAAALAVAAALVSLACQATPPTAPAPTLGSVTILYSAPTRPDFTFQLRAYALDSDGAYTDVTTQAQWTSSNPAVLQVFSGNSVGGKSLLAQTEGVATILARYEGLAGELFVQVPTRTNVVRRLTLNLTNTPLSGIGDELRLRATYNVGLGTDVTALASWTSSDPSIASVQQGVVTSLHIGTTQITAAYQGETDYYLVSVHPGRGGL